MTLKAVTIKLKFLDIPGYSWNSIPGYSWIFMEQYSWIFLEQYSLHDQSRDHH